MLFQTDIFCAKHLSILLEKYVSKGVFSHGVYTCSIQKTYLLQSVESFHVDLQLVEH